MHDRISLGALWEETAAFVRAEAQLLLPVAFTGFGLPPILMELAMPDPAMLGAQLVVGPWMWGFIPYALVNIVASVSVSALALRPGVSVREAIGGGLRALPVGVLLVLLGLGALAGLTVVASVAAGVEQSVGGRPGPVFVLALLGCFVAVIATAVRVLPLWAVLAQGSRRPLPTLARALALTKRAYLLLLLLRVVAWLAQVLTMFVLLMPIAVVLSLIGWATGARHVAEALTLVSGGAVVAVVMMVWTVYVARLTRRLESSISGT
ncbi:hypothetical protein [Sphingomonas sp.]|uniref:hypothetical protein n=1 Tax=Sphingomonas sp. TaxID=28214 RepID=UPI003B00DD2C